MQKPSSFQAIDSESPAAVEQASLAVLGGIVERGMPPLETPMRSVPVAAASAPAPALTAVAAVVGRGFPRVDPAKSYRRRKPTQAQQPSASASDVSPAGNGVKAGSYAPTGLSAHVQPEEGKPGEEGPSTAGGTAYRTAYTVPTITTNTTLTTDSDHRADETFIAVGGGASVQVAHQWSTDAFRELLTGYYTHPLPPHSQASLMTLLASSVPSVQASNADGAASTSERAVSGATGEAFFQLLFQCLRSTVRRHQDVALQVLGLHLESSDAADLRERCVHGPDCAPFLFFLISLMASAGHPMLAYRAACCLVRLLPVQLSNTTSSFADETAVAMPSVGPLVAEVFGEIGAPLGDAPDDADDDEESEAANGSTQNVDDAQDQSVKGVDTPFSELSELLRHGEDARAALEKMHFSTRVLMALPAILSVQSPGAVTGHDNFDAGDDLQTPQDEAHGLQPHAHRNDALVARLLLCGGAGSCSPKIATLLAESHAFRSWVEAILADLVLGQRTLADSLEVLVLLYRVAHVQPAAAALLRPPQAYPGSRSSGAVPTVDSFYETWSLFFTYVLTCPPRTGGHTVSEGESVSIVVSALLLRELVRHGHRGEALLHDLLDVLLTDGMRVGGAIVLEMWLLSQQQGATRHAPGTASPQLKEAALAAYQLLTAAAPDTCGWLDVFAQTANAHYLATFLSAPSQRAGALTLLGTAVDTQTAMQKVLLGAHVLTAPRLDRAFARLTTSLGAIRGTTTAKQEERATRDAMRHGWTAFLALQAAQTYADVRLMAAVTAAYLGVSRPAVLGFAASLAAKFEEGCVGITDHAEARVQNDELATMSEVVALLDTYGPATTAGATSAEAARTVAEDHPDTNSSRQQRRERAHPYQHAAQVAAFFTLHGIALTKHCLDAVPALVVLALGGTNRHHTDATRDLAQAALVSDRHLRYGPTAAAWYAARLTDATDEETASSGVVLAAGTSPPGPLPAKVALAVYLEEGVLQQTAISAAVSAASTALAGAPRSWLLFPLVESTKPVTDDNQGDDGRDESESMPVATAAADVTEGQHILLDTWARWLRQVLGLHRRLKHVLGYDSVLSHMALWTLAHRQLVFGTGEPPQSPLPSPSRSSSTQQQQQLLRRRTTAASSLTSLLAQLASLLLGEANNGGGAASALSAASVKALQVSLQATVEAESEEPLSLGAFVALVALATQCPAQVALTLLQTILAAPLVPSTTATTREESLAGTTEDAVLVVPFEGSDALVLQDLNTWGRTTTTMVTTMPSFLSGSVPANHTTGADSSKPDPSQAIPTSWTLENLVSLLELVAPLLSRRGAQAEALLVPISLQDIYSAQADDAVRTWCVSMLVSGVWQRLYLGPRLSRSALATTENSSQTATRTDVLSFMEREVLRDCLEGLRWRPKEMWPYVDDSVCA